MKAGPSTRAGIPLGKPFGIALFLAWAWVPVVVAGTLAGAAVARRFVAAADPVESLLFGFVLIELLLVSLAVHEAGHVVMCRRAGVAVHRVVLGVPGGSTVHAQPPSPRAEAQIAAGGPLASLALAVLCGLAAWPAPVGGMVFALLGLTGLANALAAAFTLLPGLPMDGGRLLRAAVWHRSSSRQYGSRVAAGAGYLVAVLLGIVTVLLTPVNDVRAAALVLIPGGLLSVYLWLGARSAEPPARHRRTGQRREFSWQRVRSAPAVRWAAVLILAAGATLMLRAYVAQSFVVTSGSMRDTLSVRDRIVVDKLAYRLGDVERGDVVVFGAPPGMRDPLLVKRVVGLPGDRLETRDGLLYRNGAPVAEDYLRPGCAEAAQGLRPTVVPAGTLYVLGDNRCHSLDSRKFGPIDARLVEGRAWLVVWPLDNLGAV